MLYFFSYFFWGGGGRRFPKKMGGGYFLLKRMKKFDYLLMNLLKFLLEIDKDNAISNNPFQRK
jgi:hypothetical protein